jgi:hypothetical protein
MRSLPKTVTAARFNRIRLALIRLGAPVRVPLSDLGSLEMILDQRRWLCVDVSRDALPMMAWTDFDSAGRDRLDQPVRCTLHLYHAHASILMGRVPALLDSALRQRLSQ